MSYADAEIRVYTVDHAFNTEEESIWLSQKLMSELFSVDVRTISEHLKNIFESGELDADSVVRNFRITAADGKSYNTQ